MHRILEISRRASKRPKKVEVLAPNCYTCDLLLGPYAMTFGYLEFLTEAGYS